jgi:hypothetical protein
LQQITENSFTPYEAHGVEKITAWRGKKIFLGMQENGWQGGGNREANKLLQIRIIKKEYLLIQIKLYPVCSTTKVPYIVVLEYHRFGTGVL